MEKLLYSEPDSRFRLSGPLKVFCCAAPEDRILLEQLKKHLMALQRQGDIIIWSDLDLPAGSEWERERRQQLTSSDLILLLISPDFMHSDYCSPTEAVLAIERYNQGTAHIIPILLRPTHWEETPFARFHVIPTNAKPVSRWRDYDEAFHDITGHIKRVITHYRSQQKSRATGSSPGIWSANPTSDAQTGPATPHQPALPLSIRTIKPQAALHVFHTLTGHTSTVGKIVMNSDGQMLASWGADRMIKLWNARSGLFLHTLTGSADNMALSSDGQVLASWGSERMTQLWHTPTSKRLLTLRDHAHDVQHMALSPEGHILACSGNFRGKYTIKLWNIQTGQILHTFKGDEYGIHSMALSRNGHMLACSGNFHGKERIKLWDVQTGKLLQMLKNYRHSIHCLALSADGEILAGSGSDWTIKLWNTRTGQILHILTCLAEHIALSADGKLLACSGSDQAIKLWNVQTGELLSVCRGHTGEIHSLAFSADGYILASGSEDKTIKIWGIKAEERDQK